MAEDHQSEQFVRHLTASQQALFAYVLTLLPDADAARDVLQNTNIALWRKSADFQENTSFIAWACEFARFEVLAYRRNLGRDRHVFDESLLNKLAIAAEARQVDADSLTGVLEQCCAQLPKQQRDLIRQRYRPGASVQAIAKERGQSARAVSVTLSRIRRALMECIERRLASGASK